MWRDWQPNRSIHASTKAHGENGENHEKPGLEDYFLHPSSGARSGAAFVQCRLTRPTTMSAQSTSPSLGPGPRQKAPQRARRI